MNMNGIVGPKGIVLQDSHMCGYRDYFEIIRDYSRRTRSSLISDPPDPGNAMQCSQAHPHSACWVLFFSITCFLTSSVSLVVVGAAAGPSSAGAECAADVFLPCAFPDADAAIQRFSKVLSFPTVSNAAAEHHVGNADVFLKLEQCLSEAYPKVNDGP